MTCYHPDEASSPRTPDLSMLLQVVDGLLLVQILQGSSELQVRDGAIGTDLEDVLVQQCQHTQDRCLSI